ncbi:MAG TPA: flagellar motor switch protein FliM [Pirellulaceae bacterium]|jgi:flagellar motor switch protein FliM|nr:flagellar motor switch protein FliM [Pirellulaceae bacterium]
MSDEVLSHDEVENLLSSLDPNADDAQRPAVKHVANEERRGREKIVPYDFKRPERVGKEQMRALQTLHDGLGRNFSVSLSNVLRSVVDLKLVSVDQLTYGEFVFSLENPTCFVLLKADPLPGNLILDLDPVVLFPMIDRLLGGGKESGMIQRRALTEIELKIVERIVQLFLRELKRAWETLVSLELAVEKIESNPQLVQVVPPSEVVILVTFEACVNDVRGMINLCIPYNSIERIGSNLAEKTWAGYGRTNVTDKTKETVSRSLDRSELELVVRFAPGKISVEELIGLRVGDVILTEHDVRQPLTVSISDAPKFLASPGQLKGKKAIQIEKVVSPVEAPKKG